MTAYIKDSNAVLDFKSDWSEWLAEGETIATREVIVPDGITKDSDSITDAATSVTAWLSGGTAGINYTVTYRVVTNQGRTDDRSIQILVRER
jgi:hypothetical protein